MKTLIDGRLGRALPADDRGFLFGETVFETLAVKDGDAPLWNRHMARLERGAVLLSMRPPDPELLLHECRRIVPVRGRAVLRITLSAGSGGRGYWPARRPHPRRVIQLRPWPRTIARHRRHGLRLITSSRILHPGDFGQGLKHGNRLIQVAAARECALAGADEALLLDERGHVVEAISSNILLVVEDNLFTHPEPAVAGIGLGWLRDHPGLNLIEARIAAAELSRCSEILVINSVAGIRPVVAVDGRCFDPGPVCRRLQSLWKVRLP